MGLAASFPGYRFEQEFAQGTPPAAAGKGEIFDVYGTVYWTVDIEGVNQTGLEGVVSQWNGRGYKVAFLLHDTQRIESFVYGGVNLQSVDATADLHGVYGTPAHHRWAVWGLPRGQRQHAAIGPNVVTFKVHVRFAGPAPDTLFVPVLSRHWEGSFAQSMPGLWVVRRS